MQDNAHRFTPAYSSCSGSGHAWSAEKVGDRCTARSVCRDHLLQQKAPLVGVFFGQGRQMAPPNFGLQSAEELRLEGRLL
jgi:hypothetical protein